MQRPMPDPELIEALCGVFAPSPDMAIWAKDTFIADGGALQNDDHAHLIEAEIGFLWTNVTNAKKGRRVIGMAEQGTPMGAMGRWSKARAIMQVEGWFGSLPDFIITIDADWWLHASDAEACALVEHELYHCAQDRDEYGAPKFSASTGRPAFAMRGHDVEEFVGVVRRYGADASGVRELVDAALAGPEIAAASISMGCGNCRG